MNRTLPNWPYEEMWEDKQDLGLGLADENRIKDWAQHLLEEPCRTIIKLLCGSHSRPLWRYPKASLNIGNPDRVLTFLERGDAHENFTRSRLVVEEKTPWALPLEGIDLVTEVNNNRHDPHNKFLKAVHQLYGYMSMNFLKYGILTTVNSTRLFRRVHDDAHPQGVLECSPEIDIHGHFLKSPLAAYSFVACLCYKHGFMHISLDPDATLPRRARIIRLEPKETFSTPIPGLEMGRRRIADAGSLRLYLGDVVSGGHHAYTARAKVFVENKGPEAGVDVIIKIYDLYNPQAVLRYQRESMIYNRLLPLQGAYVPRLYASGMDLGGGFGIQVLEDCGNDMDCGWLQGTKELARKALSEIHSLGVLHGDIHFRNITYNGKDTRYPLRIIDLGEAVFDCEIVTDDAKREEVERLEQIEPED